MNKGNEEGFPSEKKRVGRLAYGIEGIKKNLKFRVFKVKIKCGEKCEETESVFVIVMLSPN